MPFNEKAGTGPRILPPFKQAIPAPVKGMNTVRPPHEVGETEMTDSINFWISPYGRFGSRWGTSKMMPVALSKESLGEKQYPIARVLGAANEFFAGSTDLSSCAIEVNGVAQIVDVDYTINLVSGVISFKEGHVPDADASVVADIVSTPTETDQLIGTGDASKLIFPLPTREIEAGTITATAAGLLVAASACTFDLTAKTLTFDQAPAAVGAITAGYTHSTDVVVTGESVATGDGSTTAFSLANGNIVAGTVSIYIAGLLVDPSAYTLTLATGSLSFSAPPLAAGDIAVSYDYAVSITGRDIRRGNLPVLRMDYLPKADAYIVFAGRRVFAIPRKSRWGLGDGWTWGEWEARSGKTIREALPPSNGAPPGTERYAMSDKGVWYHWIGENPLSEVADVSAFSFIKEKPGGRALYVGDLNSVSDLAPVTTVLFYGRLYVASGGALQAVYVVEDHHLDDDPHTPEDRRVGDIYVETVAAHALSNPAPDAAGALAIRVNRLWVAERNGSKVWFSGVDDAKDWGWDATGTDPSFLGGSFNIDKDDGGVLSGVTNFKDRLVCFKYDGNGVRSTIHRVLGTMSGFEGDAFRREQIAEGISATSSACVCSTGDDVLFAGPGGIYALQLVDSVGNVGSIPQSLRIDSILDKDRVVHLAYSARRGMVFSVLQSGESFMLHRGAEAWFRFIFAGFSASSVSCLGDDVFWGGKNGQVYLFDDGVELDGVESDGSGGANPTKAFLSRVFSFGQPAYRSFLEKFMLAAEIRSSGRIYLDVRTDYGAQYERTIPFTSEANVPTGWDYPNSIWDDATSGWDRSGIATMQAKISKASDNFQLRLASTAALDILEMICYGSYLTDHRYPW